MEELIEVAIGNFDLNTLLGLYHTYPEYEDRLNQIETLQVIASRFRVRISRKIETTEEHRFLYLVDEIIKYNGIDEVLDSAVRSEQLYLIDYILSYLNEDSSDNMTFNVIEEVITHSSRRFLYNALERFYQNLEDYSKNRIERHTIDIGNIDALSILATMNELSLFGAVNAILYDANNDTEIYETIYLENCVIPGIEDLRQDYIKSHYEKLRESGKGLDLVKALRELADKLDDIKYQMTALYYLYIYNKKDIHSNKEIIKDRDTLLQYIPKMWGGWR